MWHANRSTDPGPANETPNPNYSNDLPPIYDFVVVFKQPFSDIIMDNWAY